MTIRGIAPNNQTIQASSSRQVIRYHSVLYEFEISRDRREWEGLVVVECAAETICIREGRHGVRRIE